MGYRKAAMMHRYQRVRGHYRTSRSGKTYWVREHDRNGPAPAVAPQVVMLAIFAVVAIPATFGLSLLLIPVIGIALAADSSTPSTTNDPATWSAEKREAWLDQQYKAARAADTRSAEERFEAEMARYTKN
jgi:hypothetical protein